MLCIFDKLNSEESDNIFLEVIQLAGARAWPFVIQSSVRYQGARETKAKEENSAGNICYTNTILALQAPAVWRQGEAASKLSHK